MSSPVKDAQSSQVSGSSNSISWTHTTTHANSTIAVCLATFNFGSSSPIPISSLTASGVTFTRRKALTKTGLSVFATGTGAVDLELWYGYAASASAYTITAVAASIPYGWGSGAVNYYGIYNSVIYIDPNGALVANGYNATSVLDTALVTYSTTLADDMLIAVYASGAQTPQLDSSWAGGVQNVVNIFTMGQTWKSVSAVQTNATLDTNNGTSMANGGMFVLVDAITADAGGVTPLGCGPNVPTPP